MFKVIHKNSNGCILNGDEAPFSDETDTNDKVEKYLRENEFYVGDIITVVEM